MAATSAVKTGIAARAYRNTGTYGSPTWTALNLIKDARSPKPWDMVEAGSRETRAKLVAKTRIDLSPQLVVRADDADAGYAALVAAAISPTTLVDMMILDGPVTTEGVRGVRAEWHVSQTEQPQEADGVIYDTFDLKPGWSSNGYPSSVAVGTASACTFTAF